MSLYNEDPLDRLDFINSSLNAISAMLGSADDLHCINGSDLSFLLDIVREDQAKVVLVLRENRKSAA